MNTVIKNMFDDSSGEELQETLDTFWSEYTNFNHKIDPFDSTNFIWGSKDIRDDNSHLYHQK